MHDRLVQRRAEFPVDAGPGQRDEELVAGSVCFDAEGIVDITGGDGVDGDVFFGFRFYGLIGKCIF